MDQFGDGYGLDLKKELSNFKKAIKAPVKTRGPHKTQNARGVLEYRLALIGIDVASDDTRYSITALRKMIREELNEMGLRNVSKIRVADAERIYKDIVASKQALDENVGSNYYDHTCEF